MKCALLIEERTSIPFCCLTPKEPLNKDSLRVKALEWFKTSNYSASDFRIVIQNEKNVPKKYKRIEINN